MEIDICAATRRMLEKGMDVPEHFTYFAKRGLNVPKVLATLEAGGIDTSAIKTRFEQEGISLQNQKQE